MKRIFRSAFLSLLLCTAMAVMLTGCGGDKSGGTIDEPEITGEYLAGEYAQQLTTDGAEIVLGSVDMEKTEDGYSVSVAEKEVVVNDSYEKGYYIADRNLNRDVQLGPEARIACDEGETLGVVSPDEFIEQYSGDDEQLYQVYLMGESAELLLAVDPEDVQAEQ